MPSSEKIAIAAHLHVLLRRKTGRVTDTEWLAANREYAAEITRFARNKAREDGHPDLALWADKLEEVMAAPELRQRVPLVQRVADVVKDHRPLPSVAAPGPAPVPAPAAPQQQGGRSVNTEEEVYPESGFIESTFGGIFGDSDSHKHRVPKDPNAPRYVKGLR